MRRVVVTGIGIVSPLGAGVEHVWRRLVNGESGISSIQSFDVSDLPAKIAGQVPRGDIISGKFNPDDYVTPKDQKKMDDFILMAMAAAQEAVTDSGWEPKTDDERNKTGVMIGSGIGGLNVIYETSLILKEKGPRRVSPFFIPAALINLASGHVSIKYGYRGPNHSVVTACATGSHAIGDAARMIMLEDADVMVAGGAESTINRLGIAGFAASRALSTAFNDNPTAASRPWDKDRDGFVMGEGSGILVLEEYEHAKARGAKIYAEVIGYGMSGDAHHITAPAADGNGGYRAMQAALKRAKLNPDEIELGAVKRLFGEHAYKLTMSSTKSAIGHLLGAAGAVEAIFSILALRDQVAPPTLNLDNPSEGCDIDLAPKQAKPRKIRNVLSNSFGFGGTNASLVFSLPN